MAAQTYPATPYLRRLTLANGWRAELIRDRHGEPTAIVAVRVGPTWIAGILLLRGELVVGEGTAYPAVSEQTDLGVPGGVVCRLASSRSGTP